MSKCVIEEAIANLATAGLRVTKQRRAMLEVLSKVNKPLSAEETYSNLKKGSCDLVTVYRSLEQLERVGVVQLGVRENGTKVYCLSHGNDHHHHYPPIMWSDGKVDVCMGDELEKVGKALANLSWRYTEHA